MQIIEEYLQSKTGNNDLCEDTYLCNEHFAAVIDGATNVSGELFLGKTPGQHASVTIKETILGLSGTEDIQEIIAAINHNYEALYKRLDIAEEIHKKPYIRPSAAMIIYSKHHHQVWMVGDCQCFHSGELFQNIKRVDEVFEEVRSIVLKGELLTGSTVDELLENDIGFDLIKPLIQKQYNFQNTTPDCSLSYGVVNGFPIPDALIKTIDVPKDLSYISLGSDGYPRIFGTLEETEAELARLLEIDPLCIEENMGPKGKAKGQVSYDDRSYIRVKVR